MMKFSEISVLLLPKEKNMHDHKMIMKRHTVGSPERKSAFLILTLPDQTFILLALLSLTITSAALSDTSLLHPSDMEGK